MQLQQQNSPFSRKYTVAHSLESPVFYEVASQVYHAVRTYVKKGARYGRIHF